MSSEEHKVLLNTHSTDKVLMRLLRGKARKRPPDAKAISLCALLVKKKGSSTIKCVHFASPKLQRVGSKTLLIHETIRSMAWPEAIDLWLKAGKFLELVLPIIASRRWFDARGFVIALHKCKNGLGEEEATRQAAEKACDTLVEGNSMKAFFLKRFKFIVYSRDRLVALKALMKRNDFFARIDADADLVVVLYTKEFDPLKGIDAAMTAPSTVENDAE